MKLRLKLWVKIVLVSIFFIAVLNSNSNLKYDDDLVSFANEYAQPMYYGAYLYLNGEQINHLVIPDTITSISAYAFYGCVNLTKIEIPSGTVNVNSYAFRNCTGLTGDLLIPESVTSIGEYAFSYCSSLTSVVIGDSVTSIGGWAFQSCNNLTRVYYKGTASDWSSISIGSDNYKLTNATRYYYSETQPTEAGRYWHYDENGEVVEREDLLFIKKEKIDEKILQA